MRVFVRPCVSLMLLRTHSIHGMRQVFCLLEGSLKHVDILLAGSSRIACSGRDVNSPGYLISNALSPTYHLQTCVVASDGARAGLDTA